MNTDLKMSFAVTSGNPTGKPTVRSYPGFDAHDDAAALRKAMKGLGTNEKALTVVVANRTNAERMQIAEQYKREFGRDLVKDVKSELSGKFEDLVVALLTPLAEFYADELHAALSGVGTDEDALVEILATLCNHEIRAVCNKYEAKYKQSLEHDLGGDTNGNFKRLLISLSTGSRDESTIVDPIAARQDAEALLRAGAGAFGTDESTFNAILCTRSRPQLRHIFMEYERLAGHDLEKAIKKEFAGTMEAGLLAIVKSVRNMPGFFADRLYASMAGKGTRDRALIRIVVTRCEVDMADIKDEFKDKYGKTVDDFVKGDTSGDYQKCLIDLLN